MFAFIISCRGDRLARSQLRRDSTHSSASPSRPSSRSVHTIWNTVPFSAYSAVPAPYSPYGTHMWDYGTPYTSSSAYLHTYPHHSPRPSLGPGRKVSDNSPRRSSKAVCTTPYTVYRTYTIHTLSIYTVYIILDYIT